jgi:DNA-binding response OmpR family regulator
MAQILLIETDRQLLGITKSYLQAAGHQINAHTDIQAAILSADAKLPEIVILDLMLAGRSGIEFLYELRSYPEWHSIPVIIRGNYPLEEISKFEAEFKQLDVGEYFHKPSSSLAELLQKVDHTLQPANV